MRRILTHAFVILANFLMLTYIVASILQAITMFMGAFHPSCGIYTIRSTFGICLIYQIFRHKFDYQSFGEALISNFDKEQILNQRRPFSITRIPLFILILSTFVIFGDFIGGLAHHRVYSLEKVILYGLLSASFYYGIRYFITGRNILPIFLIIAGPMLLGLESTLSITYCGVGGVVFAMYVLGSSITWLIVGLIYNAKRIKSPNT